MIDLFETEADRPERIGIIGGSGLYELLGNADHDRAGTPYGKASDAVAVGELAGRPVAFLPRHGDRHQYPPHQINYRANLWALRRVGVTRVVGVGAVGSLTPSIAPGSLVVPDQLVDRTAGRPATFFEHPHTAHAPFADPYCAPGRAEVLAAASDWPAIDGGTQVVIEGPRFSTRAESRWYAAQGWSLVGMTALPEVALARELGMCYLPLCLVTDLDAGVEVGAGVTQEEVMARFAANLERIRGLVGDLVADLPLERSCDCAESAPNPM
ncbi:5'-methylthioadenosine phosphorylase [Stackebrandtia endophytica]|uniref:Purine nucleoside phosphorylase n=1 Tax=Stackebrandtia endophytica TaxID=1496996 RepID=A0A543B0G5_9ACTN|nr:S-methyl-5'-thioadenosine phosphorylase [Stackebrandtia endophytica]TQL78325.1 5'-methylthioadenosine phosphorylase [Stackebrandtia endophytica]